MPLDPMIKTAIEVAVKEAGQPPTLARKIESWMDALVSGDEDIEDEQLVQQRLELIYKNTEVLNSEED